MNRYNEYLKAQKDYEACKKWYYKVVDLKPPLDLSYITIALSLREEYGDVNDSPHSFDKALIEMIGQNPKILYPVVEYLEAKAEEKLLALKDIVTELSGDIKTLEAKRKK